MKCPLCRSEKCRHAASGTTRNFILCERCALVFVPADDFLTENEERNRYALHDNTPANQGYVRYLSETADCIAHELVAGGTVLDYGCGEQAVLTGILIQRGIRCTAFDPLYEKWREGTINNRQYNLVVLNEVIEHCRNIRETIEDIRSQCAPGGKIVVRTRCYPGAPEEIPQWWYAQDPTHVLFFSPASLQEVARQLGRTCTTTSRPDIHVISCG